MDTVVKNEALEALMEILNHEDFREDFVKKVNKSVDVPIISEKTERKIINALYNLMVKQVEKAVEEVKSKDEQSSN